MIRCPRTWCAVVGATSVALCAVGDAAAQTSSGSPAMAEALFQEGWKLIDAGKVSEACPKFAESNRIEPKSGTLVALATCHEREGKTASAWLEFTQAASATGRGANEKRVAYAREHAQALERNLSRVVIEVVAPDQRPTIQLDGTDVGAAAWGTAVPVDPGNHLLAATAAGKVSWSERLTVGPGPTVVNVRIPSLVTVSAVPAPVAVPPVVDDRASGPSSWTPLRITGVALVGAGVVGIAVGAVFGVRTLSQKSDGEKHCHGDGCDPTGVELIGSAHDAATASTIAFAAGATLAAGGVVLVIVTRPKPDAASARTLFVSPSFAGGGGTLTVGGAL